MADFRTWMERGLVQKLNALFQYGGTKELVFNEFDTSILRTTVEPHDYKLLRGMGLFLPDLSQKQLIEISQLKPGMPIPKFLKKTANRYSHYTKVMWVAEFYSKERFGINIIMEGTVPGPQILLDSDHIDKLSFVSEINPDALEAARKGREVIVIEPVATTLISINIEQKVREKFGL